jgi:glyoxylase-like metal-dependent hydrolase (beta-lactamase superfamily II)
MATTTSHRATGIQLGGPVVSLITMAGSAVLSRRFLLARAGRVAAGIAVFGLVGCGTGESSLRPIPGTPSDPPAEPPTEPPAEPPIDGFAWERVVLGNVSAYVLVRAGEAVVVDTGNPGSTDAIEAGLAALGVGWDDVGHVVLTHLHGDHVGSAAAVMDLAPDAIGYAGGPDIPGITVPRPLQEVADGDRVFDLRIIATPGHTAGSISVHDPIGGILVAGDALRTGADGPAGPNPAFTADEDAARASVAKLGSLAFETLLVGHGEPITSGASALVAALAAS